MNKPTCEEIFNEELEEVYSDADPSWRHGCYMTEVYKREADNTFWEVTYQRSTDGEYNGLRDNEGADITQVEPYDVTVTKYRQIKAGV